MTYNYASHNAQPGFDPRDMQATKTPPKSEAATYAVQLPEDFQEHVVREDKK
jgi:hypothetical protein